jgi:hypothetical protein
LKCQLPFLNWCKGMENGGQHLGKVLRKVALLMAEVQVIKKAVLSVKEVKLLVMVMAVPLAALLWAIAPSQSC